MSTGPSLKESLEADVRRGFAMTPKTLPPKYFYDVEGSGIFEKITELPEYYVTRAESAALGGLLPDLMDTGRWRRVVELGSGSSTKTKAVLEALHTAQALEITYSPIDISKSALSDAAVRLTDWAPWLRVEGFIGDFLTADLDIAVADADVATLILFLGSTLGNLFPSERQNLLRRLAVALKPDDAFLVGLDLVKSGDIIEPAYNDAAGITEEFNKNVIRVLQRELGATCSVEQFDHYAPYVEETRRVEMRLYARTALAISFPLSSVPPYSLLAGEYLLTEISQKFERHGFEQELEASGLHLKGWWTDPGEQVALALVCAT
ncbi:MAG: L-histidine N(alpha)-methyltransferase [Acidimicrobiales bacterium]